MSAITVHEPREVLAYVPYALGFQPTGSIAVVSLRAGTNPIGLVAPIDIDAARYVDNIVAFGHLTARPRSRPQPSEGRRGGRHEHPHP